MAVAVVSREDNAFADDNPPPARNAILARYRQLREISKRHHHDILKFISGNAMPHGGNNSAHPPIRIPITGAAGCCPRATAGHATAAPLSSVTNSRRPMKAVI